MVVHDYANTAYGYMAEANEKVKTGTKQGKTEATRLYLAAALSFNQAKKNVEAGKAYNECAGQHIDIDNFHTAAFCFTLAGYKFKKDDPSAAILAFNRATDIFTDREKYYFAANRCTEIAEIYEGQIQMDKATEYYTKAANYYAKASSPCRSLKNRENMARISANLENYKNAIDIYEEVAKSYTGSYYMEPYAKGSYMRAAICAMCLDKSKAAALLDKYSKEYPPWETTKECRFIKELLKACDEHNVDKLIMSHQHAIYLDDPSVQGLLLKVQN